jgi:hypothetical protein
MEEEVGARRTTDVALEFEGFGIAASCRFATHPSLRAGWATLRHGRRSDGPTPHPTLSRKGRGNNGEANGTKGNGEGRGTPAVHRRAIQRIAPHDRNPEDCGYGNSPRLLAASATRVTEIIMAAVRMLTRSRRERAQRFVKAFFMILCRRVLISSNSQK